MEPCHARVDLLCPARESASLSPLSPKLVGGPSAESRPPSDRPPADAGPQAKEARCTECRCNVDDVQRVVDELSSTGVTLVHYPEVTTDEKGISPRAGAGKVAWFRDPDGNTFAVESAT